MLSVVLQLGDPLERHERPFQCLAQVGERSRERFPAAHGDDHERSVASGGEERGAPPPTVVGAVDPQQRGGAGRAVPAEDLNRLSVRWAAAGRRPLEPPAEDGELGGAARAARELRVRHLLGPGEPRVLERHEPVGHHVVDVVE
jgi:hypothetical protein